MLQRESDITQKALAAEGLLDASSRKLLPPRTIADVEHPVCEIVERCGVHILFPRKCLWPRNVSASADTVATLDSRKVAKSRST